MPENDRQFLDLPNAYQTEERRRLLSQQMRFLVWKVWIFRGRYTQRAIQTAGYLTLSLVLVVVWGFLVVVVVFLAKLVLPVLQRVAAWLEQGKERIESYIQRRAG